MGMGMGSGEWGMRSVEWGMGNGECGVEEVADTGLRVVPGVRSGEWRTLALSFSNRDRLAECLKGQGREHEASDGDD